MEQNGPLQYGPYVVLEQIGAGGMGAVYRARDRRLERDVAIKVLHRHLEMASARERFLREARAVSSLNHPNISTIFDIGEQDGDPYLVMELLHGQSLKDRLVDGVPMLPAELEAIATQAALALAAAHAKGIVHRDIKPANLFLVDGPHGEKQLKVLDFGLAKMETDRILYGDAGGLTRTGSTVGTVEYMSPEQARGEDLDARSDLFSLGAVLYELATGDVPFRGATSAVVFAELLGSDPVPPRMQNSHLSPGMDAIIRKLLEKKRENRIQSATVLLEDLRKLKHEAPARPSVSSGASVTSVPQDTPAAVSQELPVRPLPSRETQPKHVVPVQEPTVRGPRIKPSGSRPSQIYARTSGSRPSLELDAARLLQDLSFERAAAEGDSEEVEATGRIRWWIPVLAVLLLAGIAAAIFLRPRGAATSAASVFTGSLQITQFDNSTGNAVLQETPAVAMQILLKEMPSLHLTGFAPSPDTVDLDAAEMAKRSGAAAYLTGSVSRDGERYHVHAEILKTTDSSRLAQEDVDAASMVELPNALSRLAVALRTHMGETPEQAGADTVQLANEATASLSALALYARGSSLLRAGQPTAAVEQFQKALADDPSFVTARLDLVESLRQAGAEPERLQAAALLKPMAGRVGVCERNRAVYEIADAAGALDAAQQWATACPTQTEAQIALARQLLAAGRGAEAEAVGNKAVLFDPAGRGAITIATEAMISQDHYESALKQQAHAVSLRASTPGLLLLAAYLRGDLATESMALALAEASSNWQDQWAVVTYLANRGRLVEASRFGQGAAARLQQMREVASTGTLMRTRISALQAMAGHCDGGAIRAAKAGDLAEFYAEIAGAWCKHAPGSAGINDVHLATIARAADTWSNGDAQGALDILQSSRGGRQAPVAAMLRGEIHLAMKERVLAIGDFQAVITKRGASLLTGTLVYPAAQAGLATAYHRMGDEPNAARVEDDLKALWKDAPRNEPLLRRAVK
ncbi:serine/threonine protein kinase [Terriglobus roseus DSM 18391]|uniref:Serine/threonine protein kinase n=1 Tax=Terriglobus roseus (strain DSM 18391 / NRRL B-41598 / KBS 63) TaxID=926566 RepID=I3ZG44_TERRK|nr:serine/threonine-protein kinase [Terriglobus roseus]AFL88212.1 serine/threonine protein kinase [Terriglobus roseus DSM 18391]